MDRLDEEKLATLRRWGDGLARDDRDEVRAAGRAILLLAEEVELLHLDIRHVGAASAEQPPQQQPIVAPSDVEAHGRATLRDRIAAIAARAID